MKFSRAITRVPGSNYKDGLTTVDLGIPDFEKTVLEHAGYMQILKDCGLELIELPADLRYPDSTFVEDTAVLLSSASRGGPAALLSRPGALSRAGEVQAIKPVVQQFFKEIVEIAAPGTLDGGDICEAENHFIIGISLRTNENGARQLSDWLIAKGYKTSFVDIRSTSGILHLKSGISYIGDNRMLVIDSLASHPALQDFELIHMQSGEEYAANCIRVNDRILIADGYPHLEQDLLRFGYQVIKLDMSEFQKMDGGLSCLSLRF